MDNPIPNPRERENRMRRFNVPLNGNQRRIELIKEVAKLTYNAWPTWDATRPAHGVSLAYLFAAIAGGLENFAMNLKGDCPFAADFQKLFAPGHDVWLFITEEEA